MAAAQESVAVLGIGAMGHGMASSALRAASPRSFGTASRRRLETSPPSARSSRTAAADAARRAGDRRDDGDRRGRRRLDRSRQGMLAALAPGAIWVQMSTIGVAGIERVAAMVEAERRDVLLVDAPVSGSKDPAEQGALTIFASGPDDARPRVRPLFDALGQRTIWVGAVGAGSRLKLVNNTWLAFGNEAIAASVALAHRLGLDH